MISSIDSSPPLRKALPQAPATMPARSAAPANMSEWDTFTSAPTKPQRPVLLYNEHCEVCDGIAGWVKREDAQGGDHIDERPIPIYQEDLDKIAPGLDLEKVYEVSHL